MFVFCLVDVCFGGGLSVFNVMGELEGFCCLIYLFFSYYPVCLLLLFGFCYCFCNSTCIPVENIYFEISRSVVWAFYNFHTSRYSYSLHLIFEGNN